MRRLFDISEPVDAPKGEKILWDLAEKHLPDQDAGDYNQALMDLGATICVPKNPRCLICPLMKLCKARINGTQNERPVKLPKKQVPHFINVAGVIVKKGRVLLALRPSKGLLGGMWEFPNGRVDGDPLAGLAQALKTGYNLRLRKNRQALQKRQPLGIVHHGYSHFTVSVYVYACELESTPNEKNLKWVWIKDLNEYPMGRIDRQIAHLVDKQSDS